jgi:DNA modification methylase
VGSGFGKRVANWIGRQKAYPTNVLYLATETRNRNHSAVFPDDLPKWFIRLFTQEGDWVLDPFMGSGTTIRVAQQMGRNAIGIEILPEYYQLAKANIPAVVQVPARQLSLLEETEPYESTEPDAIHSNPGLSNRRSKCLLP